MNKLIKVSLLTLMISTSAIASDQGINIFAGTGIQGHEIGIGYQFNKYLQVSGAYGFGGTLDNKYHTDIYNGNPEYITMSGQDIGSDQDIDSQSISMSFHPLANIKYLKRFKLSVGYIAGGSSSQETIAYKPGIAAGAFIPTNMPYATIDAFMYTGSDISQGIHTESEWEYDGYMLGIGFEQQVYSGFSVYIDVKYAPTSVVKQSLYMDKNDMWAYFNSGAISAWEDSWQDVGTAEASYHSAEILDDVEARLQAEFEAKNETPDEIDVKLGIRYTF